MVRVTRKVEFDSGHRVYGHEGKCAYAHGHRYVAEITASADELDPIGRVVDFSVLKTRIGKWVDDFWDHNFLVHHDDPLRLLIATEGRACYIMKYGNPTAENIAKELFEVSVMLLGDLPIVVEHIRIYETPNCWADYGRQYTTTRETNA